MSKIILTGLLAGIIIITTASCKKYLEASTNKKLVVISNLRDAQSLLDDYYRINYRDIGVGEESADDYFLPYEVWSSLNEFDRGRYVWNAERVIPPYTANSGGNSWSQSYDNIYVANTVLDNIDLIPITDYDESEWKNVKGQALFLRGKTCLQLAWIWSLAYDSSTAQSDLGIPLRTSADFNIPSIRSNVQQTYDQIIKDLKEAANLLPKTPVHVMRPSKSAAYGYLARTFLSMRNYKNAALYADSCLQICNELLDYNEIVRSTPFPTGIGPFNKEVLYKCKISLSNSLYYGRTPNAIFDLYDSTDLRKSIFYREDSGTGLLIFMGSYEQDYDLFSGIATDEMFLIRSECYARADLVDKAMDDLNALLIKRWKTGTFIPFSAYDKEEALSLILLERRKELLMRGLRWADIKRLNKEGRNIILSRTLNQEIFTLKPNDLRYALAIPEDVISLSGIPQNLR